jgi:phosphatidylinositol-4,5-bisphosphate 3-kinase
MYVLLQKWPHVSADTALELLGNKYPDRSVREFAVKCLEHNLCDDTVTLYMMPLIQVSVFVCEFKLFLY